MATIQMPDPVVEMLQTHPLAIYDFLKSLPDELKCQLLIALLEELAETQGDHHWIPLETDGKSYGYYIPPGAMPKRSDRPIRTVKPSAKYDPKNVLTVAEINSILHRDCPDTEIEPPPDDL